MNKRWWLVAGLAVVILLAGCAMKAQTPPPMERPLIAKGGGEMSGAIEPVPGIVPVESGDFAATETLQGEELPERLVVRTASLSIVVSDPTETMNELAALAEKLGGFVVSSSVSTMRLANGREVPRTSITFRVPADKFQDALTQVRAKASRIETESISGQDVTEEYVDLQARLRNLQAAEQQLQEIMDQATRTEDVLQVYRELTNIRGEIERLQGRIRYLEQSAAMSAITVDLIPDEAAQPLQIGGWEPKGVAKEAVEALIRTLQSVASLLIWLLIYLLPVLVVLGLIFGLPIYSVVRWWRARRRVRAGRESEE